MSSVLSNSKNDMLRIIVLTEELQRHRLCAENFISGGAKRAVARHNNVTFVRSTRASVVPVAVDGGAKEVSPGIHTGGIDVVVFGVFAHIGRIVRDSLESEEWEMV